MFLSKDFRFKHKVLLMHNMLRQSYTRISSIHISTWLSYVQENHMKY